MSFDEEALMRELRRDEAFREYAYDDATGDKISPGNTVKGNVTVGIGRNLTTNGLTEEEARYLAKNDIASVVERLRVTFPWFDKLEDVRQRAFINLTFNVGFLRLLGFRNALAAMARSDYGVAANELLDSEWAAKVGARAHRIAAMVRDGVAAE